MRVWDEKEKSVEKVTPDKKRVISLLKIVMLREKGLKKFDRKIMSTLIVEAYYEIIKELMTAILSINGYKTISHEMLIAYILNFCKTISLGEAMLIDQLRKARNDIAYRGVLVKPGYLERNEQKIINLIEKLKNIIWNKLETNRD